MPGLQLHSNADWFREGGAGWSRRVYKGTSELFPRGLRPTRVTGRADQTLCLLTPPAFSVPRRTRTWKGWMHLPPACFLSQLLLPGTPAYGCPRECRDPAFTST